MIRIEWQGQTLNVRRVVLRTENRSVYERSAHLIARELGLEVADESALPNIGDFWIGCHPRAGWGDSDPAQVGWASFLEVPLLVGVIRASQRVAESDLAGGQVATPRFAHSASIDTPLWVVER